MRRECLAAQHVLERLEVDIYRGELRWRPKPEDSSENRRWNTRYAGHSAGKRNTDGYLQILIQGHLYLASHLIWLVETGKLPKEEIDHENRVHTDNGYSNLREATRLQNNRNALKRANRLGVVGVTMHQGRYLVQASGGPTKSKYVGVYDTIEEASAVYQETIAKRYGEFAPST